MPPASGQPVDLAFATFGPEGGFPVLLLHGFPLDRTMWARQAEALAAAGYRVLAPDLRGHGKSPVGAEPATMELMAKDVARLVLGAGAGRFALVGFSMGGYVAFELWREMPQRVAGLALVDTRAEPDPPEAREGRAKTAASVRRKGTEVLAESMLPKLLTEGAPDALKEEVRRVILANPKKGAADALLGMAERADARELLPKMDVPSLVLVGAQDPVTPPDAARAMAQALPRAELVVVEGAAHLTPVERPDEVTRALLAWLERVRGGRS